MSMTTIREPNFMVDPQTGRWIPMIERCGSHSLRYSLNMNGGWVVSPERGEGCGIAFLRDPASRLLAGIQINQIGTPHEVIDHVLDTPPRELPNYLRPQYTYPNIEECHTYFHYQKLGVIPAIWGIDIVHHNPTMVNPKMGTVILDHRVDELQIWFHQDRMLYEEAL